MQVRIFQSADMASGLKMIKQELGPDALILSTKTIRNGKLGLLSKPMLEITAAIDTEYPASNSQQVSPATAPASQIENYEKKPEKTDNRSFNHIVNDPVEQFLNQPLNQTFNQATNSEQEAFREFPSEEVNEALPAPPALSPSTPDTEPVAFRESSGLEGEVNELKNLVKALAGQITELNQKEKDPVQATAYENPEKNEKILKRHNVPRVTAQEVHGDHLLSLLISRGINVETARSIAGFMRESLTEQELCDPSLVTETIIKTLQNLIEVNAPKFSDTSVQRRIALIGPTGVGKTTTLAKIAASYLKQHSKSIALITIDTYRIAAVEQLKVYGEIMHLPVDVVITPEQLTQALIRHQDKELILIDTAGRSPRDSFCIDELASFLAPEHNIEKHLVLSATTRENELVETINQFSKLEVANTIFTKIDECLSLGVLLNTQLHNSNPISYITNGQRVPEDLLEITPIKIAELIMSQDQGSMHE
ncbi:flagellar biosynthesis protein FlhF [Desulforhopalus sp. 52FAK]